MKRYILKSLLFPPLVCLTLNAQNFVTASYITLPGNNNEFDVFNYGYFGSSGAYLCWVNQIDSTYSIYLRRTVPDSSKNILIYSSTEQISKPKIAVAGNTPNMRIVWQMMVNNHWQILSRELIGDSLSDITDITDSLSDNITPAISQYNVVWINNGNLYYKSFDTLSTPPKLLDSADCSNPDIVKFSSYNFISIAYEKGQQPERQIYEVSYNSYNSPQWSIQKISNGSDNINPHFSLSGEPALTFQTLINGKWHTVYQNFGKLDTTDNQSYNCEYSESYSYMVLGKKETSWRWTPYFIVYDSDSLGSNRQIYLKTLAFVPDTSITLSDSSSDNYYPRICFEKPADTMYIAILWIHDENGKKDIWMAKTVFNPLVGAVESSNNQIKNFNLFQNYPNPFNPSTVISYQLSALSHVKLKVYDVLGREVAELVNDAKPAGTYKVEFDASKLSSGVYFYQLKAVPQNGGSAGEFIETKKLLLLK